MIFLSYKKIYTRIIGIGRDLADVMERGKMDELCVCVQETRLNTSKARCIGGGFIEFLNF